jgi:protein-disulfide isomerase
MRCEKVRENIADYLGETLPRTVERELKEHLVDCSSCRSELNELRDLWTDLGEVPVPAFDDSTARAAVAATISDIGRQPLSKPPSRRRFEMREALKAAAIVVVLAGLAAGATMVLRQEPAPKKDGTQTRGIPSAPITLVEYGDYECPPCFSYHNVVKELVQKYPATIQYEYRHFPLTRIHPNALPAAIAAEAAAEQGKFWEMHDLLVSSRDKWSRGSQAKQHFVEMARQLGLDVSAFRQSLESSDLEQEVVNEMMEARQAGIENVPTFFLNGNRWDTAGDPPHVFESKLLALIRTRLGLGTN